MLTADKQQEIKKIVESSEKRWREYLSGEFKPSKHVIKIEITLDGAEALRMIDMCEYFKSSLNKVDNIKLKCLKAMFLAGLNGKHFDTAIALRALYSAINPDVKFVNLERMRES